MSDKNMYACFKADSMALSFSGELGGENHNPLHKHEYHELIYIKKGISLLGDHTCRQPLFGSSAAFIPAEHVHRSVVIGDSITFSLLLVRKDLLKNGFDGITIFELSKLGIELMNVLCTGRIRDVSSGFPGECLKLLLLLLTEDFQKKARIVRLPEAHDEVNLKILDYIKEHYNKKIVLGDFEKVLPYSSRHLSRLFNRELKISIFEYLRLYRILMASVRLCTENEQVAVIAFDCGYDSLSAFYSDFKKYYGLSPRVLRGRSGG